MSHDEWQELFDEWLAHPVICWDDAAERYRLMCKGYFVEEHPARCDWVEIYKHNNREPEKVIYVPGKREVFKKQKLREKWLNKL